MKDHVFIEVYIDYYKYSINILYDETNVLSWFYLKKIVLPDGFEEWRGYLERTVDI